HTSSMGSVDDVQLDGEVGRDELGGIRVIGQDSPHLGRGEEYVVRALRLEEGSNRLLLGEVELLVGADHEVAEALARESADDCTPNEAAMTGNVDAIGCVHGAPPRVHCGNEAGRRVAEVQGVYAAPSAATTHATGSSRRTDGAKSRLRSPVNGFVL